jgi:hypothetical protein
LQLGRGSHPGHWPGCSHHVRVSALVALLREGRGGDTARGCRGQGTKWEPASPGAAIAAVSGWGQVESSISSSKSQPCFLRLDRYLPRVLQLSHAPLPQSILFWQLEQLKWWPCADCPVPQEIFHPTTVRWPGSEPSGPEHTAGQSVGNAGDANWVLNT